MSILSDYTFCSQEAKIIPTSQSIEKKQTLTMILNKSLKIFPRVRTGREKSQIQEKLVRLNVSFSVSEPKQSALPGHTPVLTLSNSLKPGNDI